MIAGVQRHLLERGLYPGPVDGVLSPLTHDAVRTYQTQQGLPVDGGITPELLGYMRTNNTDENSTDSIIEN